MLKRYARDCSKAVSNLWLMEDICDRSSTLPLDQQQLDDTKAQVQRLLGETEKLVRNNISEFQKTIAPEVDRFNTALQSEPLTDIARRCDHLRNRILDELAHEFYFKVRRGDIQLYGRKAPFGATVAKKFKRAGPEIIHASNCLALRQPTACVFHLMRAMEVAVRQLARRLQLTITAQTTWGQLTSQMDPIIRAMPAATNAQRRKKGKWEEARVNLHHVRSVWRNSTMHPANSYTDDQARHIFNATRVFMNGLCDL
jgi:hypothetical protein